MTDCCIHWTGCIHCPTCGFEADLDPESDPLDVIVVRYDPSDDTHYLECPQGHRFWFREKVPA